jgi:hypothetical protein
MFYFISIVKLYFILKIILCHTYLSVIVCVILNHRFNYKPDCKHYLLYLYKYMNHYTSWHGLWWTVQLDATFVCNNQLMYCINTFNKQLENHDNIQICSTYCSLSDIWQPTNLQYLLQPLWHTKDAEVVHFSTGRGCSLVCNIPL